MPVSALAALAAAVLDDRGVDCTDVIGFSYGGAVAQQLAYDYPERVRRLVLAATNCGLGSFWGSPAVMAVMATPLRFYSAELFRARRGRSSTAASRDATRRSGRAPAVRVAVCRRASTATRCSCSGGVGWSSWSFLPDIPHETLVVCGDDDPLVPLANAKMLAERIPRAKLAVVERAGHLLLWDEPERVAPQIGKFVGWD